MTFKFPCPHCGQRIAATEDDAETTGRCPTCQQAFIVPNPEIPAPALEPLPPPTPSPRRGLAISALLLSFLPAINLVAVILAICALVRSNRPGREGERRLAIAAVIVSALLLIPVNLGAALATSTIVYFKKYEEPPDFMSSDRPATQSGPTPAAASN